MSCPCKSPACARSAVLSCRYTARALHAAISGGAQRLSSVRVCSSGSPGAPRYRAACRRSAVSGSFTASGIQGIYAIALASFFAKNGYPSIPQHPCGCKRGIFARWARAQPFGLRPCALCPQKNGPCRCTGRLPCFNAKTGADAGSGVPYPRQLPQGVYPAPTASS